MTNDHAPKVTVCIVYDNEDLSVLDTRTFTYKYK